MTYSQKLFLTKFSFLTIITFFSLSLFSPLSGQEIKYSDSWGDAGYTLKKNDDSGVKINFSVTEFSIRGTSINGEPMQDIALPGTFLPNDEGAPNLPGTSRFVAVPQGATPKLIIKNFRIEKFENISMAPAPRIPLETEDGPLDYNKNPEIYNKDAFYPENPIRISEPTQVRGMDAVILGITPFQYNPVTQELIVYRDVEVEIRFTGGTGHFGDDRLRSRWWDPILQDMFINRASIPEIDYNKRRLEILKNSPRDEAGCEYLIVVPNNPEFTQWADSVKLFRQKQGIITKIVTLAEIGTSSASGLENYFNNAYNTWDIPPAAVLLLADYGTNTSNRIIAPIWDSYCASDNIYADVNNNKVPDIIFARITATNSSQLQTMVSKFINYERNPPTNPGFYDHPITALGWQTERWFQICSETVGGFWRSQGKNPVRINAIYQGNPSTVWSTATNTYTVVNYFGPNGQDYIPATPAELGGWTGGNANMVNNAINNGAFMLQHRDHGYEQGWGEPGYSSSNINALHNTDLCFIFSINCLTGKYNWSGECFAEKFHRYTKNGGNSGALGIIAASEVSYSFVNDTYVWGMYDNMWPEFLPDYGMPVEERGVLPAFANASGKYFLKQSSWPYNTGNKEVTYNLFHHHGGAFLTVYSEVPQNLVVTHEPVLYSGADVFTVSANPGALVALTVDGEIIGTGVGTGFPTDIAIEPQIPETEIVVTVTKQNYFRYESTVEVIPPEGCHIVYNNYEIDDVEGGNGNGLMDYGENILLDMTLKNVGMETAENIEATISTQSEYVTIINNVSNFGNIDPDATETVAGAYTIQAHDDIPDQATIDFVLTATDGTDTWESTFSIIAHAPVFEISADVMVSDPDGNNNGRLDPGETADIYIPTTNIGTGNAYAVHATILTNDPFLIFNTSEYDLDVIEAGANGYAVFNVSLHEQAPNGFMIQTDFSASCVAASIEQEVLIMAGANIEDFETGDLSKYDWQNGGSNPWFITGETVYEGNYSLRSGAVGDGQMCILGLSADVVTMDSVSFYRKVSSQSGDVLQFFVDGALMGEWSGEKEWEYFAYPVDEGIHNLIWRYYKDGSGTGGEDCAWVDFIELPPMADENVTAFAGWDETICEGNDFQTNAYASYYESLLWSTSGTGTFDDPSIPGPVYTPSDEDISSGFVTLTLTAIDGSDEVSDDMMLTFMTQPGISNEPPAGDSQLCLDPGTADYTVTDIPGATGYVWEITPAEAGTVTWEGQMAQVTYASDFAGACQLMVKGTNQCGEGEWSSPLEIHIWDTPETINPPDGPAEVCAGETNVNYVVNEVPNADEIVWELTPSEAGTLINENFEVNISWSETFSGEAMLRAQPINVCSEGEWSDALIIEVAPLPDAATDISGKEKTCMGTEDSYQTNEIGNADAYEWVLEPEAAGILTQNNTQCSVSWDDTWNGNATLSVRGVNACGQGAISGYAILVQDCTGIDETESNELSIYPNPNNGLFHLTITAVDNISVRLYNATGKLMLDENNIEVNGYLNYSIDAAGFPEGVYHLMVTGNTIIYTKKVIISK